MFNNGLGVTGYPIPYASISVTRQETGEQRDVTGDREGGFTLPGLTPGSYGVEVQSDGFRTARQSAGLRLSVGQTTVTIRLELAALQESVTVSAGVITVQTSTEARLSDSFTSTTIQELPLTQRDIFGITKLSVGATLIPGSANSAKLTSSPVVTVNGNRYRAVSRHPEYFGGGAPGGALADGDVRVGREGVFVGDLKVAELAQVVERVERAGAIVVEKRSISPELQAAIGAAAVIGTLVGGCKLTGAICGG